MEVVKFTYIMMLLQLFSCLSLVRGGGEMDIVRARLQRLETRFAEDIALLRREFYQSSDTVVSDNENDNEGTISTETKTPDVQNIESEIENFKQDVFNSLETIWDGIATEKRVRRNIQLDINSLRNTSRVSSCLFASCCNNISRMLDILPILEKLQKDVAEIASKTKIDPANTEVRVAGCFEWLHLGYTSSGVYAVFPDSMWRPLNVYCDMETDGGGWTVFQRRMDGSEDFYRNWMNYTFGFGNLSGEFWLGNEYVHRLTSNAPYEMRIDMEDFENDTRVAKYGLFSVGPRSEGFVLSAEYFTGDVKDSLIQYHHKQQFSTHDVGPSTGCAQSYKGGWWYNKCHGVNINGLYHNGKHDSYADGINWRAWRGHHYSLKKTEMKFRPR